MQSPDLLSANQLQGWLYYLVKERKLAWSTCNVAVSALRSFYELVVGRDVREFRLTIPRAKTGWKLAKVLDVTEVEALFYHAKNRRNRVILMTIYLSRYVYRIAIDDTRIKAINVDRKTVTFSYKDYRKKGRTRMMTLDAVEFIHRFLQHVLTTGFVKVRYYGLFAHVLKEKLLAAVRKSLKATGKLIRETLLCLETLIDSIQIPEKPQVCPKCHGTNLIKHRLLPVKHIPKPPPK